MQRQNKPRAMALVAHGSARPSDPKASSDLDDDCASGFRYMTYRPLSNLPTPPPTYKDAVAAAAAADAIPSSPSSPMSFDLDIQARYLGPAIHLVNLIPSKASLAPASVNFVQAMLSRADLPLETIALAVCLLDSLDSKFARAWRLCCPLLPVSATNTANVADPADVLDDATTHCRSPVSPSYFFQSRPRQMPHIDSVRPELIILAALVIAVKFTHDPQQPTQFYCLDWGKAMWSHDQLNATERCIMESLNYRIMPLCNEDYLTDAMVDMQLAARQGNAEFREHTPPVSLASSDDDVFASRRDFCKTSAVSATTTPSREPLFSSGPLAS